VLVPVFFLILRKVWLVKLRFLANGPFFIGHYILDIQYFGFFYIQYYIFYSKS
jgi:hypothetical protein